MELENWGFLDYRIVETIAVTKSESGFNVAPMGVVSDINGESAYARLWKGSDTLENVSRHGEVRVCFSKDPLIYAKGAMGNPTEMLGENGVPNRCDAWLLCNAEFEDMERDGDVEKWMLEIIEGSVVNRKINLVNRGFNSVIEASVHSTRLEFRPELRELVNHHLDIARKCGGEREKMAADYIEEQIKRSDK